MKKLILVSAVIAVLVSCDNDDNPQEPIIGIWSPVQVVNVAVDGTENSIPYDGCAQENSRFTFFADGTRTSVSEYEDPAGDCIIDPSNYSDETWKRTGVVITGFKGILYEFKGDFEDDGVIIEEKEIVFVTFSEDKTVMNRYSSNPNTSENYSYTVYKRVPE